MPFIKNIFNRWDADPVFCIAGVSLSLTKIAEIAFCFRVLQRIHAHQLSEQDLVWRVLFIGTAYSLTAIGQTALRTPKYPSYETPQQYNRRFLGYLRNPLKL